MLTWLSSWFISMYLLYFKSEFAAGSFLSQPQHLKSPYCFLCMLYNSHQENLVLNQDVFLDMIRHYILNFCFLVYLKMLGGRYEFITAWYWGVLCDRFRHFIQTNSQHSVLQVHLLDFPNIVIKGSELQLPFQACLKVCSSHLVL